MLFVYPQTILLYQELVMTLNYESLAFTKCFRFCSIRDIELSPDRIPVVLPQGKGFEALRCIMSAPQPHRRETQGNGLGHVALSYAEFRALAYLLIVDSRI